MRRVTYTTLLASWRTRGFLLEDSILKKSKSHPAANRKQAKLAHLPDIGKMGELIAVARAKREGLRASTKARKEAQGYETAAHWEYGEVLERIRQGCTRKGDWGKALVAVGETKRNGDANYNRAEEAIGIHQLAP